MENQVKEIVLRLKGTRISIDLTPQEMAAVTGMSVEDYLKCESGESDFSFTFLYKCAQRFGIDMSELIQGEGPKLTFYTVVKKGEGMDINRREGFTYQHLAPFFKDRLAEPFVVTAPYSEAAQSMPIPLSTHEGQEMDLILKGKLKVQLGENTEYLQEGDCVYYNSGYPHGMVATGGEPCEFLALVLKPSTDKESN